MAEENLNLTNQETMPGTDPLESIMQEPVYPTISQPQDYMSGTPETSAGATFETIKESLIEGPAPLGEFDVEGLKEASAIHNMVAQFPVNSSPVQNPKDVDVNEDIFGSVIPDTLNSIKRLPNEAQPVRFSIKGSNFDRYYHHPKFQELGYHPFVDNETLYNRSSTWWDENSRMWTQYKKIFSTGFLSTYNAIGDWFEGDYTRGDLESAEAFADAMRVGNSTQEGTGAFFNNLLLNSGYTVGIISNIAAEELALGFLTTMTGGIGGGAAAQRTAYNAKRTVGAFDKLFDVGSYAESTRKMLRSMKNVDWAKDFWRRGGKFLGTALTPNTYRALKTVHTTQEGTQALSNLAKVQKTFGGFYRDVRAINLAMAESKLEGGMVKRDLIDKLYAEFVEEHGRAPVGDELSKIVNKGDEASFTTTMLNAPVIYFSNAFIFDNMLRGFRGPARLLAASQRGMGSRIIKRGTIQKGQQAFFDVGGPGVFGIRQGFRKFINRGFRGNLKSFAGAALNYGRFNFIEGIQEITQEAIAEGAKDYYYNLYQDPMASGMDARWASTLAGAKSQMSGHGFEVFMSGFLMGGLVQGPQRWVFNKGPELYQRVTDPEGFKEYQTKRQEYIDETVKVLNEVYENPLEYFDLNKINALNQKEVNEALFASTFAEDARSFMDSKDSGIFKHLYTILEAGKMHEFKGQMEDILKLDDEGLSEAFKSIATEEEVKEGKLRERVEGMLGRMEDVEKSYKELNDQIVNPFNPKNYKVGTKEHMEEAISWQAFNHAKMLALFTRNTFERALERSNQIYTELSSNPIISKMDANDIAVLADTPQLIAEIRLLKLELKNMLYPVEGEGKAKLSVEDQARHDKKKKRLELLQSYFAVLTDPENIEKQEEIKGKETEKGKKQRPEDEEFNKLNTIIVGDAVKKTREDILSTDIITDSVSEHLAKYETKSANPFGIFDIDKMDMLEKPFMDFLNEISENTKDGFIKYDDVKESLIKLIDRKSLKGRAEDYNKAIMTIMNPNNLVALSEKIAVKMKELYFQNKKEVKKRMEKYLDQVEKNEFLNQLAEKGIYPEAEQAELFLKGKGVPNLYITSEGPLTPESNLELYKTKDEILGTYLNLSNNKMQEEEKKAEDKKDETAKEDTEHDPYNFENTHFEEDEDSQDIGGEQILKYTGNKYGDAYLVRKHKEYLLSQENSKDKGKILIDHAEWLASPISKKARVVEHAINRIYDEIYLEEQLLGSSENSFYGWLATMKDDPRVSDILRIHDVKITDIIEPNVEEGTLDESKLKRGQKVTSNKKSHFKVVKQKIKDRESQDEFNTYTVVDNDNNPQSKIYTNKTEANQERVKLEKERKNNLANLVTFPFAGTNYKKGDILIDGNGQKYMVFSTPAMVETHNNIYLKKLDKIKSKFKKDKIFLDEAAFKQKELETVSEEALDYRNRASKLKSNEPLVIFPIYDRTLKDRKEQIEEGKGKLQTVLRNLTEEDIEKIEFRISPGPAWFSAQEKEIGDKSNFKEAEDAIENDLIKKHGQKWQVEVIMGDRTIGFFQGPTTLKLLNRKLQEINPMEITESQVQDLFKIYKSDNITDKTKEIQDNYYEAFQIYDTIDKLMKGEDGARTFTAKELGVSINISDGSMAIAEEGQGVLFEDLEFNTIANVDKADLRTDEDPYFILDYNKQYKGEKEIGKVEYNIITNIKTNTPSYRKLKEEVKKYEKKFSPQHRMGKYVAFVTLPNGRSAFIYLTPKTMNETEVVNLFTDMQNKSIDTIQNNIGDDGKVKKVGYNKSFNAEIQQRLFLSATEGVYLEIKLSEDGSLRVDYSDLNVPKAKRGQKQKGIPRAKMVVGSEKFQKMQDVEELLDLINEKIFGKNTPLKGKSILTLDNFKHSVKKDPTIDEINKMSTRLDKEVKKDINFSLSSTESIKVIRRNQPSSVPMEKKKTADELSPDKKRDSYKTGHKDVDPKILEEIAKKQLANKELTDLESRIASFNIETLKGLRLKLSTTAVNSVNTQEELDNQNAVSRIRELTEKIKQRKLDIRKLTRDNPESKDKSNREIHEINKALIANDPEIKKLEALLAAAKGQANKIAKNFDGHDIEDIETFIEWVKNNLPDNVIVDIDNLGKRLKDGYISVGQFIMHMKVVTKGVMGLEGVITVGANKPFKYHEAFHAIFRMFLTDVEINKYLSLAKKEVKAKLRAEGKTIGQALAEMRKQHSMYAEMPADMLEDRLYEEYLADEFEKFKMNPRSTNTNSENKSFFRKIIDAIVAILRGFKTRKLNHLFEGIDSGKYKNASIKENRFTKNWEGDVAHKLELFDPKFIERTSENGSSKVKAVKNWIPSDQQHEIISGIASLYTRRLSNNKDGKAVNKKILLDEAISDWIEMYNPERDFYVDQGTWYDQKVDELTLLYNSLLDQLDLVREMVDRHLVEFATAPTESIEDADYTEQDEKSVGDYDKSADMFGGYSSLPKRIRHIIATTTIEEVDRYGNQYINEETKEPLIISVNPNYVYNGLLKVLANTPNDLDMWKKAWTFSRNNDHTKAVINKLFKDLGLKEDAQSGEMFREDYEIKGNINDGALYLSFIKGFKKYRVDNIFAHTDTDTGITHLYAANKKDDAHSTVKQWAEDFNKRYSRIRITDSLEHEEVKDALTDLTGSLKLTVDPKNYNLEEYIRELAHVLKNVAGINIHPNYILYSIYNNFTTLTEQQQTLYDAYKHVDPIEVEAISHIRTSIVNGENIYLDNQTVLEVDENQDETDVEYYKGGVKGRLRKLALNNAQFDEAVGASTFIDAEGNRRYAHQDPTFHLVKIAEMEGAEYISEKLKEDVYFNKNMLLKNPKFMAMVAAGQVRPLRIVGSKEQALMLGELGLSAQRGRDISAKGVSFGKSTPKDFALDLIHSYLYNYNRQSPKKTRTGKLENDDDFAIAPTFIRVIEASNTGDFVALPVHKMLNRNKEGIEITERALDMFVNEVKIEFERARRYHLNEKEGVENLIENKERLGKLNTTYTLLTKLETRKRNIQAKLPEIGRDQRDAITSNKQKVYLSTIATAYKTNLSQGEESIVEVDGESFKMINQGRKNWKDLTDEEKTQLIDNYRPSITTIVDSDKKQYSVGEINGVEHFTYNTNTQLFFKGYKDLVIFQFERVQEEDTEVKLTESEETGEVEASEVKLDKSAVERLEEVAKTGIKRDDGTLIEEEDLFNVVFDEVGGREIIKERLQDEINEFILTLKELKAYNRISKEVSIGLGEYVKIKDGRDTAYDSSENEQMMELYNFKQNDLDFNLAQIYLNNYINSKSVNQLLLGDQAMSLKDFVDAVKRAKMQNAAGSAASTEIYDESVGVMHKVDRMSAIVHEDFKYDRQFNDVYEQDRKLKAKQNDLTDGQIYITQKTLRYMLFGFGKLNKTQAAVLDDIAAGRKIKLDEEFFGTQTKLSHKNIDMIANSLKIVYGDGLTYLKMSAVTLTPEWTSIRNENGEWVAREGREGLHNMRVKLEKFEQDQLNQGNPTLAMSVPISASKMMNKNVMIDNEDIRNDKPIDPKYSMDLSADFMRLQMINPSNKIEIVDARQIKNLISGEQDPNSEVIINGKVVKVKDLIIKYHKLAGDKLMNNYFAQRNLTFSWKGAMSALDKVKNINKFVSKNEVERLDGDLRAFVRYAVAGLEASQAKTQMLSYFQVDEFGEPQYNLNGPFTHDKFEELFLSFFSKGILASKQPGISAALASDANIFVIKKVKQVDETGTPVDWQVIRSNDWEILKRRNPGKYKAIKGLDGRPLHENLEDHDLKEGDFFMDRLRSGVMEYKDNKPTGQKFTEFMMPPHFKSQLKNSIAWDKPLPDAVAKMFGLRIPSQDKHSAVNLKLVDYLPVYMGSTGIYARELIELSGADFDIDKLYMQIKEFFYDSEKNEFIEYGKVDNPKEGYRHYIRWVVKNATKNSPIRHAILNWNTTSVIEKDMPIPLNYAEMSQEEIIKAHKDLKRASNKIVIGILDAIMHGPSLDDQMLEMLYNRAEGLPEALELLGLPVSFEEYQTFLETNGREPYQAAIDNELLDVKFGLLGNKGITDPRSGRNKGIYEEPAVTTPLSNQEAKDQGQEGGVYEWLKDELGDILDITGENRLDIDSLLGQIEAWTNNKEGARSIGNVVLPNVLVSILTEYKIKLRKDAKIPELNGIKYTSFEHDYEINHNTKKSDPEGAHRKMFIISALITAMTDNAKLRLAAKLSLKKQALANVVTMLGMGVDLKTSVLLLQFPTIKEALFHGENKTNPMDPGYIRLLERRLINIDERLMQDLIDQKRTDKKHTPIAVNMDNLITGINNLKFDRAEDFETYGIGEAEINELLLEKAVIEEYLKFNDITETTRNASTLINLQKGLGRDLTIMDQTDMAAEKLGLKASKEEFKDSDTPVDLRDIFLKKGSMHNAHYNVFRELYDDLLPKIMVKRTPKFLELKNKVLANMGYRAKQNIKDINRDLLNYLTLKAYMVSLSNDPYGVKTLESLQNNFIYDPKIYNKLHPKGITIATVVDRIKTKLFEEGKTNYFLDNFVRLIRTEHEDNKSGTIKLESNTWTQFSDSELVRVQNSILELLNLDSGDGAMWDDVQNIVHYLAVKDGMSFGDGSFINVIPSPLLKDLLNNVDKVHDLFLDKRDREGAFKGVFGITFDEMVDEYIKGYLTSKGNAWYLKGLQSYRVDVIETQNTEEIPAEDIGKKQSITVDHNLRESVSNSKMLSNQAFRKFVFDFNNETYEFGSVMHAFQVLRSGKFDANLDKKYKEGDNAEILKNAEGKVIESKLKRKKGSMEPAYLLEKLVEESILQNLTHEDLNSTLLPQQLISAKNFNFPVNNWISKATERGLLNARKNLRYLERTEEEKQDPFSTRSFVDARDISDTEARNKRINKTSPLLVNSEQGTLTIDIFKAIPSEFINRIKRMRFLTSKKGDYVKNQNNLELRNKYVKRLKKAGLNVKWIKVKIDDKSVLIPQIEFPAVIRIGKKVFMLEKVFRDKAYVKEGDLNTIIPSDSDIAYGNRAEYSETELFGSSTQTKIGFMFGDRPTSQQIIDYGKDKRLMQGDMEISSEDEQSDEDVQKWFGDKVESGTEEDANVGNEFEDVLGYEEEEFGLNPKLENGENNLELSDEEILVDWYDQLTTEQQTKLATNDELGIFSAKDVVSLLNKGKNTTATDIIELLKKCYI